MAAASTTTRSGDNRRTGTARRGRNYEFGHINVRIYSARNVKAMVPSSLLRWRSGWSNCYIKITSSSNNQTETSEIASETLEPTFNDSFSFPLVQNYRSASDTAPSLTFFLWHAHEEEDQEVTTTTHDGNVLIGKSDSMTVVPVILASGGLKRWVSVKSSDDPDSTGEILIGCQYEPSGPEPKVGDRVKLLPFLYPSYTHVLPHANVEMTVLEVSGHVIFVTFNSAEGWEIKLSMERSLLCNAFTTTSNSNKNNNNSHGLGNSNSERILRSLAKESKVVHKWMKDYVPPTQANQVYQSTYWLSSVSSRVWKSSTHIASSYQRHGTSAAWNKLKSESSNVIEASSQELQELDWSGKSNKWFPEEEREVRTTETRQVNAGSSETSGNTLGSESDLQQLTCPITGCMMVDPVVAADGHSYDREAILEWFSRSQTSPMTGASISTTQVFPNYTLKKMIEEAENESTKNL